LTDADLRIEFQWQLTVLRFIEARFKPAVLVTDEEIESYYRAHQAALARAHPGKASLDDLTENIRDTITGEKVNKQFFSWLDQQRQSIKLQFREVGLS
jgi:methyltransferase-like protein